MCVKSICLENELAFLELGNSVYVCRPDAERFVECCRIQCKQILGIDGFHITESSIRPIDSLIADFSSLKDSSLSSNEARFFLALDEAKEATHFEFVITNR